MRGRIAVILGLSGLLSSMVMAEDHPCLKSDDAYRQKYIQGLENVGREHPEVADAMQIEIAECKQDIAATTLEARGLPTPRCNAGTIAKEVRDTLDSIRSLPITRCETDGPFNCYAHKNYYAEADVTSFLDAQVDRIVSLIASGNVETPLKMVKHAKQSFTTYWKSNAYYRMDMVPKDTFVYNKEPIDQLLETTTALIHQCMP